MNLREGGGYEGRHDVLTALAGMGHRIAHEVQTAPLPSATQHLLDRRLDATVVVGDDQLHGAQATAGQAAQEGGPEHLGLGRTDVHAQHFAPPIGIDAHGDDHRHADDAPGLPRLHIGGVDPQIRPVAFQWPVKVSQPKS